MKSKFVSHFCNWKYFSQFCLVSTNWSVHILTMSHKILTGVIVTEQYHRCDSIQGTDYVANPFFLNLRVSKTKIENLRWEVGEDIIQVTFGKLVDNHWSKNLRKDVNKLICSQYARDSQFLWTLFYLKILDQQCHTFSNRL